MDQHTQLKFNYISLEEYILNGYNFPKSIQIIPYFKFDDDLSIYALLGLNRKQTVVDLGGDLHRGKDVRNFIRDCIKKNSLNSFELEIEDLHDRIFVAFTSAYNDTHGKEMTTNDFIPIFFVKLNIPSYDMLYQILLKFKNNFRRVITGLDNSDSKITNLIYMDAQELFYISRFTTYKIADESGDFISINLEEQGFPARSDITEMYECDVLKFEIPLSDNYNKDANSCPEVNFYRSRSITLGNCLVEFFQHNLPILMD